MFWFFSSSFYLCYLDLNKLQHPLFRGQNLTSWKTGPLPTIQKHFQRRSMATHHFLSHRGATLVLCYIMCSLSKQTIGFTSCLSIPMCHHLDSHQGPQPSSEVRDYVSTAGVDRGLHNPHWAGLYTGTNTRRAPIMRIPLGNLQHE